MLGNSSAGLTLLLAFEDFVKELREELAHHQLEIIHEQGRMFVVRGDCPRLAWAQCQGAGARIQPVASIGAAAKLLKANGRKWACLSSVEFRRSRLIQEQLGGDDSFPLKFLAPLPELQWGAWGLLDKNNLVLAPTTPSPLPRGEVRFQESEDPPSRAYLKLWEVMTVHGIRLTGRERVIDVGSCPGGWTWVLAQTAREVVSVDKAPLDPKVQARKNVLFMKKDAFRLDPKEAGQIDWLFSDIICEPPRLLELVHRWREAGVHRFVCSIKYKGQTDFKTTEQFLAIPGSRIVHLCANRHEVTWICP